jgi:uncharacterized protein with von Willebrand factor type A (vWA) domain
MVKMVKMVFFLSVALVAIIAILSDAFLKYKKAQLGAVKSDWGEKEKKLLVETIHKLHEENQNLLPKNKDLEKRVVKIETQLLLAARASSRNVVTESGKQPDINKGLPI